MQEITFGRQLQKFLKMQAVADGKKTVADEDILALMGDEASQDGKLWDLLDLQVRCALVLRDAIRSPESVPPRISAGKLLGQSLP